MDAPHDLSISSAPLRITGSGERMLAVYVSETRAVGSQLHKFILLHQGQCAAWFASPSNKPPGPRLWACVLSNSQAHAPWHVFPQPVCIQDIVLAQG